MQKFFSHLKGDRGIWLIIAMLTLISVLAVYTSTSGLAFQKKDGDTEYYLLKHMALMALSLLIMYFIHKIDYRAFARFANVLMIVSGLLLLYTLVQGRQAEVNDARRWIYVFGQSFQPSDLAKFSLMIYLAKVLTQRQDLIKDFRRSFVPTLLPVFIICGLIVPYNLSTALVIMFTSFILMFIAGISSRHMATLMAAGVVMAVIVIYGGFFERSVTWRHRIADWWEGKVNEEQQFQREQANMAIATSGIIGKGAGKSVQRHYLPQAYSDFVYAIIIEEYGLIGGIVVLLLYILLMIRAVGIATISKTFGALLAAGLSFLIVIQALINMGVTVGLLPVTGLALPLVSMGGTSLLFTALSFGVILSVSRTSIAERKEELQAA